jgi:hypothetical protein
VQFTVTPRDTWWWDQNANGWTQSPGGYGVYVGDSSAIGDLPLHGSFAVTQTAAARQVIVHAPSEFVPGQGSRVSVKLTSSGSATLRGVQLSLQLPQGWTARPIGRTTFMHVSPAQTPHAAFIVTPPAWAPLTSATVHATAQFGSDAVREAGVTTTLVAQAS